MITVLLPLITLATAQFEYQDHQKDWPYTNIIPTDTKSGEYLDKIYEDCQSTTDGKFCKGGKGNETGFPEGQGCLKDKNCPFLVHSTKGDQTIYWENCAQFPGFTQWIPRR